MVLFCKIDRETKGDGFAAGYDGFIDVIRVFGLYHQVDIVIQGDLQHHQWVLESIDGVNIDSTERNYKIPDLDFGEQITLSATTGCNMFSGRIVLRENYIIFTLRRSYSLPCSAKQPKVELLLIGILNSEP